MKAAWAVVLSVWLAWPALPQDPVFQASVKLVVVNVSVKGHDGRPIENLSKDDFQLFEDGKLQRLQTVELQRLSARALPPVTPTLQSRGTAQVLKKPAAIDMQTALSRYQDRRLIAILFDFSSMDIPEQIRSVAAAQKFISTQMTASDTVALMVYAGGLKTLQEFTDDRDLLSGALKGLHIGEGSELAGQADTGADAEDQSGQFVADETEFNIFNTDLKLMALEDAARALAPYPEKKSLIYFSSGVEKTGVDNQSQLRATINTAVRSNVAFYPIDARGLTASAPGGDASVAAKVGSNLYSGAGQRGLRDSFFNQQETLDSLAADTGGKASLDSNDLTVGMRQVQQDVDSYYILAYQSTNQAEDGRYRRIQVKLSPRMAALKPKLSYREGYYGSTTFARMNGSDKEALLQQALNSDNPVTDLPMAVEVDYFRVQKSKYFVPVSVKIPGSALSFTSKRSKAATELDFAAEVADAKGHAVSAVRDTIALKLEQPLASEVGRKQIQYDTGFTLAPGKYRLRFVARENGQGKTGTFETSFTVPDLGSGSALRLSSVVLSNQREPIKAQIASAQNSKKLLSQNPLIGADGLKTVPNVTRAFHPGQNLFVYLEVYDPGTPEGLPSAVRLADLSATVSLYQGEKKVLESQPVRSNRMSTRGDGIFPVSLQAPLGTLPPGNYTCQVNVIDAVGKKFAFPRSAIVVMGPAGVQAN